MSEIKLSIELVPRTCWYSNVRSCVSSSDWDFLRKESYENANHKCEICSGVGNKHKVECHEIWSYDDDKKIQKLERLISLCPTCHMVKHPGLAEIKGKLGIVKNQLQKINKMTLEEVDEYLNYSFYVWNHRSQFEWKIDMSFLDDKNIKYQPDRK